jgi:hypothetical protein
MEEEGRGEKETLKKGLYTVSKVKDSVREALR